MPFHQVRFHPSSSPLPAWIAIRHVSAAVRLQAAARGLLVRRRVREMRDLPLQLLQVALRCATDLNLVRCVGDLGCAVYPTGGGHAVFPRAATSKYAPSTVIRRGEDMVSLTGAHRVAPLHSAAGHRAGSFCPAGFHGIQVDVQTLCGVAPARRSRGRRQGENPNSRLHPSSCPPPPPPPAWAAGQSPRGAGAGGISLTRSRVVLRGPGALGSGAARGASCLVRRRWQGMAATVPAEWWAGAAGAARGLGRERRAVAGRLPAVRPSLGPGGLRSGPEGPRSGTGGPRSGPAPAELRPAFSIVGARAGPGGLSSGGPRRHGPSRSSSVWGVKAVFLLECNGEREVADKVSGLTSDMAASGTMRFCPWASRWGCFSAAVCSFGRGCLARSEVAATPPMVSG
ncbi:hypothetical protein QYE76_060981 [Lolium multiflorum]|uniref:Uncharacterized protein n=1 Tax=Lolium multiflorum TaxID=4521 RepID=A0AAD8RZV5_LOLMU|nr:hypothetical protein QYE76_060981 [Lolium multiflorum]